MVTVAEVRALALTLPRTTEHLVRDRVKFRVEQIVYCAFSRDGTAEERVTDAWAMCVPKFLVRERLGRPV